LKIDKSEDVFEDVELIIRAYDTKVLETTGSKIRTFLNELAEGTTFYRSLHNLTEQVEHQYHGRFIVELIQNSHDALFVRSANEPCEERIEIVFNEDEGQHGVLYVANDGRPFSSSNFQSLSQLGQSDKDPQESIGNKGIGFRSVLEITDKPEIYSRSTVGSTSFDGFCFAFSPEVVQQLTTPILALYKGQNEVKSPFGDTALVDWERRQLQKFRSVVQDRGELWLTQELNFLSPYLLPFPVRPPIPTSRLAEFERRGFATVIRFPLKNSMVKTLVKNKLKEINASTMLFLDKATSLVLESKNERRELLRKVTSRESSQFGGCEVSIIEDANETAHKYWLWSKNLRVVESPETLREAVSELPGKWPELKDISVSVGVRLGDEPERGVFSIFLPTLLGTGCATHICAPFFGDMSRTHIDFNNIYNRLLVDEAALLAVSVAVHELAGHEKDEARAIVDLLSPWRVKDETAVMWLEAIERACESLCIKLQDDCLFLSDSGWNPLNKTSLLPSIDSFSVLTPEVLRTHATFDVFSKHLDTRADQLIALADCYFENGVFPLADWLSYTLEAIVGHYYQEQPKDFNWNGFWTDADVLLKGDSSSLVKRKMLLGNDGNLHSSGEDCTVFFIPRQGSVDDEEVENEGAILDIPYALSRHISFLSEKIRVYDEKNARVQTRIRKFLDTKLVNRFRVEDIFNLVLVPRTPKLPIPFSSQDSALCSDILSWGLRLMSNLVGRGKGEKSLRLLKDLPVPCLGGWYRLGDATFGVGWPGTLGDEVMKYLSGVKSPQSIEAKKQLLLQPSDELWGGIGGTYQELLKLAGVFDGLRLIAVTSKVWESKFQASRDYLQLPKSAPPGVGTDLWEDYRVYAHSTVKPAYQGWFSYEIQTFSVISGLDKLGEIDEATRLALMTVLLGSIPSWDDSFRKVTIRKAEGLSDVLLLESLLFFILRKCPWLGLKHAEGIEWCRPSDRWHIPAAVMAGRAWQFSHLKPLPGDVAHKIDSDLRLAWALQSLGMPHLDTEVRSTNKRLLDALVAAAMEGDIPDWNVFLGQVRSAWGAFYPELETPFPEFVLVSRGGRQLSAERPTLGNPVYLPDSTKSFVAALEQFALPVVAIDTFDAKRLANNFQATYGPGLFLASELKIVPLVSGQPWSGPLGERMRDGDLEWLIPAVLTLAAFGGSQAKGTASKRFREQIETFRDVRLTWVSNIDAGLFRGDELVVKPSTPAIWLSEQRILLVSNECRELPNLLGEALSHVIDREDLEVSIKLLLKEFTDLDPKHEEIILALSQLKLTDKHFMEVREHWRGDLGQIIQMILPLIMILRPDASIDALIDFDTDEAVIGFLNDLGDERFDGSSLLRMARASGGMFQLGTHAFDRFGSAVTLSAWNNTLAVRGEPTLINRDASDEFKMHLVSAIQTLRSLVAEIVRRAPTIGFVRNLSNKLEELPCPPNFENDYWEVSFKTTLSAVVLDFKGWGATQSEIDAIRFAETTDKLVVLLQAAGVDVGFDPMLVARDNRERLRDAVVRLEKIGLAWAIAGQHPNVADWEVRADRYLECLSVDLDGSGYTARWSDQDVFGLLRKLSHDQASITFWVTLSRVSSLDELVQMLGLSNDDISSANAKLETLRENARKRRKLIEICGREFDTSDDNLLGLYNHIRSGIADEQLESFKDLDLTKPNALSNVKKSRKGKYKEPEPKNRSKQKQHLSKSIENLIGLSGEIHAFRILQKTYGLTTVSASSWVSSNSTYVFSDNKTDDGRGCDFVFTVKERTYYVEVKSSEGTDECFTLGSSEIRLAMEMAKKYRRGRKCGVFLVLRVANALSEYPLFQVLPNPYDLRYQSFFVVEEADARVRYKLSI
jgi:hypothetical protein